jgi:curli biogenesis system outer membrane secretion channel CsgG
MKKIVSIVTILLLSMFFFCQHAIAAEDLKGAALKKLQNAIIKALPLESDISRIAVLDFEGDDGTIKNAITSAITEKTPFKVIERADLDKILEEQGLQLKDIMDEQTRITHGKIKGVQGLLMGKVLSMEEGFMSYTIKIHMKLDDVEKGEIVVSKDFSVSAVSLVRNWIIFGVIGIFILLLALILFKKSRATLIKEDLVARIDLAKEIDKVITNVSGARSKLNSKGKSEEATMVNNVEGDLLHIKQFVQTAPRGSVLKTDTIEYRKVLEFDQKIMDYFEDLKKSSDRLYDMAISGNTDNLGKEIDSLKRDMKNTLNEFRNRGF